MYVFTDNAFLSILAHASDERLLEVRARYSGDIERTFPESEVAFNAGADFPYSTSVSRERAAERIALRVQHVGYHHFNPTSEEPWRQSIYEQVESILLMSHQSPMTNKE
ncbi:MAG TPA: hypothetical protein VHE55_07945 [Fimbriimonadaceae bacterium]|nr:hypothetical protein [Fimbriimonadaceae bacterium]